MGIRRGDFESANLGALAKSAVSTYHERNSIASGLSAVAEGSMNAAKAYRSLGNSIEGLGTSINLMCQTVQKAINGENGILGELTGANKEFQDTKEQLYKKQKSGQELDEKDYQMLEAAKKNFNDKVSDFNTNQFWQFNFTNQKSGVNDSAKDIMNSYAKEQQAKELKDQNAVNLTGGFSHGQTC